jgi:poly(3-hydroxybutyrate) depolymerase
MRALRNCLALGMALAGAVTFGGCSASGTGSPSGAAGTSGTAGGGAGGGPGAGGSTGGSTTGASGAGGSPTGASGAGGAATGAAGSPTGVAGAGGASAGAGGATGAGGAGGAAGGAAGAGGSGAGGAPVTKVLPSGKSAGCGMAPPTNDKASGFTVHALPVPACGTGAITPKCVAPPFAPGGALEQKNQTYSFVSRNYAVQLPTNYDNTKAYPLMVGGGGCGGGPTESGGGYNAGQGAGDAIRIGMSYTMMCFADGGNSCAGTMANQPACVNTPEVPYFYAMLADVESKYCIEKSKVYLGGYSSGGWETYTLGCAASEVIAGIVPVNGGLRNHRPACTGPMPALMVAGAADVDNPIGPLVMDMAYAPSGLTAAQVNLDISSLDSTGSAAARDALLARNGCTGAATAVYDPAYPLCMKYTGCPANAPVVWCPVTGAGHQNLMYQGVTYYPSTGAASLQWNFLTKLVP